MGFVVALCAFAAAFFLPLAVYGYLNRSPIEEIIEKGNGLITRQSWLQTMGKMAKNRVDLEKLDATLRLAGRPLGLDAESYLGFSIVLAVAAFVVSLVLWATGVFGPSIMLWLTLLSVGLPWLMIKRQAELNRQYLRYRIIDFSNQLEKTLPGGLSLQRVFQWAAEGEDFFALEMRRVVETARLGQSLDQAFINHFSGRLGVTEAEDIGSILRNAAIYGTPVSAALGSLNRDFRLQIQWELYARATRIKPAVTILLTLTAIVACTVLIVAPLVLSALREL